ncbi:MAG: non-canonical purine NTP pyrophosphatase [Pseudomonadota bacterium]|nr:non-canonical purine NTP pyrophosphatase [Pseudomonadota bacterium]
MTKLTYVTGNLHKKAELEFFFKDEPSIQIDIIDPNFEVLEIQAKTCAEVAAFSAKYAADKLGIASLKSDSGLYIECLGGLPGPYNAYFDKQIGTEKFLELMKTQTNRKARLEHCFAYCEPNKEPIIFSGGSTGIIAQNAAGQSGRWHDQFYIPDGENETLSQLRDKDRTYEQQFWGTALLDFAAWFKKNIVQDS